MRSNPQIASLVHTLNVGNWGFFPLPSWDLGFREEDNEYPPRPFHLDEPGLKLVRESIHEAGIGFLEDRILEN